MPGPLRVVNLRTEYLRNPLIDVRRPRFSWELASNARGTLQEAYRLIVAESESVLDSGTDLIWDSSRVQARDSVHVVYSGPELRPKTRYYWRVITWDNYGNESEQTERAWFEMALLDGSEWEASWIEPDLAPVRREPKQSPAMMGFKTSSEPPEKRLTPPSLLRREFAVRAGIRRARVYCTAHGIYSLEVNGQHADDREFAPEFTAYEKILCYQTYDVTALLIPGTINVLGITIADGWWAGRVGMTGDSCQYGDRHALLLRLEIDYDDGSSDCVVSDESFRCSTGPIAYSDIFIGERYDARKEIPGWSKVGFDASNWKPVKVANYMKGNLVAQHGEPVKRVMEFPAVSVLKTPKGDTVVDIGQVIAGRIRMRVSGPAGIVVSLKHTEVLNEHGNFINNIAGRNKDQEDFYILKGIGDEIWEPKFTFHGFRFVRLTGFPGEPKASDFTAVVISSSMQTSGSFECSDPLLNRLQQNIVWSQRGNMLSIPTDCPQRERAGWTGDIQVYAPTACFNSDMDAFLTRWLRSLAADQLPDGQVPFVVPYLRGYREDIAGVFFTHSSAGWGDACHLVPLTMYKKYGDLRILEECWPVMMKWMDYVEKRAAEHDPLTKMINPLRFFSKSEQDKYLWNSGFHFGDWLIPSRLIGGSMGMLSSALATRKTVASAYFAHSTATMAEIARLLGKQTERTKYLDLNSKIKKAFAAEYISPDGKLSPSLQGIYVLALQFELVPPNLRQKAVDRLVTMIHDNNDCLDTGFLSVPHLLDVLCANGHRVLATKLLHQTNYPSWLYEIKNGATTIWESWKAIEPSGKVTDMSYNHYAFGACGDWIYRELGGIQALEPGYQRVRIAPEPDGKLNFVKASYRSVHGEISVFWKIEGEKMRVEATVPCNTRAVIRLPKAKLGEVTESGSPLDAASGISNARQEHDAVEMDAGSGTYSFDYNYS